MASLVLASVPTFKNLQWSGSFSRKSVWYAFFFCLVQNSGKPVRIVKIAAIQFVIVQSFIVKYYQQYGKKKKGFNVM